MKNQEFKSICVTNNLLQQEQILAQDYSDSPQDKFFNQVVGIVQESLLDPQFDEIQTSFMKKYCLFFEQSEENKIQYTEIFEKYQLKIQKYIHDKLEEMMPGFTIEEFMELSKTRSDLLDEQFLELLQSFTDFQQFKNLCLIFKDFYCHEERLKGLTIKGSKQAN